MSTYSAALIETVVDTLPAALLLVNHNRQVTEIFISNRRFRHFRERELSGLLAKFLLPEAVNKIMGKYEQTVSSKQSSHIHRLSFQTTQGLVEYATCRIAPLPSQDRIAVFFLNESESVLLEQEFQALSEQAEASQRELYAAMSAMDFHLMDLDQSHKRLEVLYKVACIVQREISENEAYEEIINIVMAEFSCVHSSIFLLNESGDTLLMQAHQGYCRLQNISLDQGITGYAARNRELVFCS